MLFRAITICLLLTAAAESLYATPVSEPDMADPDHLSERLSEPSFTVDDGLLILKAMHDSAEVFQIYGITGQLIKKIEVPAGDSTQLELKRGLYIVRCSRWARKIMIK